MSLRTDIETRYLKLRYDDSTPVFIQQYNEFVKILDSSRTEEEDELTRHEFLLFMDDKLLNNACSGQKGLLLEQDIFEVLMRQFPVSEVFAKINGRPLTKRNGEPLTLEEIMGIKSSGVSAEAQDLFCKSVKDKAQLAAEEGKVDEVSQIWAKYKGLLADFGRLIDIPVTKEVRDFPAVWRKKTITETVKIIPPAEQKFFYGLLHEARKMDEYDSAMVLAAKAKECAKEGDVRGAEEACSNFKSLADSSDEKDVYDIEGVEACVSKARHVFSTSRIIESYLNNRKNIDDAVGELCTIDSDTTPVSAREKLRDIKAQFLLNRLSKIASDRSGNYELSDLEKIGSLEAQLECLLGEDGLEHTPLIVTLVRSLPNPRINAYLGIYRNETLRPEIRQEYLEKAHDLVYHVAKDAAEKKDMDLFIRYCALFEKMSRNHLKELDEDEESIKEALMNLTKAFSSEPVTAV